MRRDRGGRLPRTIHTVCERQAGAGAVESRQLVHSIADDRYPPRLQQLQGGRKIENRLRARADDGHRGRRQLVDVTRYVEAPRGCAVNAADASGGEDGDSGQVRRAHGGTHRGRRERAHRQERAEVARSGLGHALLRIGQEFEQRPRGAHHQLALADDDGRRNSARLPHRLLRRDRRLQVVGHRQTLGDERRFERHDRPAGTERCADLVGDGEPVATHHGAEAPRSPATNACAPRVRVTAPA